MQIDPTGTIDKEVNIFADRHGGYWQGEHNDYPINDWITEAQNGDTRQGYWEWVIQREEGDK